MPELCGDFDNDSRQEEEGLVQQVGTFSQGSMVGSEGFRVDLQTRGKDAVALLGFEHSNTPKCTCNPKYLGSMFSLLYMQIRTSNVLS